jgi:hypothetical protein
VAPPVFKCGKTGCGPCSPVALKGVSSTRRQSFTAIRCARSRLIGGKIGGRLALGAALFAFGPLTAPLAAAAVWNWRRRRYFTAALFALGVGCIWALAYGATPALVLAVASNVPGR